MCVRILDISMHTIAKRHYLQNNTQHIINDKLTDKTQQQEHQQLKHQQILTSYHKTLDYLCYSMHSKSPYLRESEVNSAQ